MEHLPKKYFNAVLAEVWSKLQLEINEKTKQKTLIEDKYKFTFKKLIKDENVPFSVTVSYLMTDFDKNGHPVRMWLKLYKCEFLYNFAEPRSSEKFRHSFFGKKICFESLNALTECMLKIGYPVEINLDKF